MPLIKKDETFPPRSVMIILVGTPFSYKTSLAITAKDPILFDLEKGSERAHGRAETYRINESWKEVEDDLPNGLLKGFKTAVIDTCGSLVDDELWPYGRVIKYTKNDMQNWGTVKDLFKKFFSYIRKNDLDVVAISHEKSKDKNDETVYDLDISGGGKQLLLRQADQIGFISKKDFKEKDTVVTKTILTFWPTASLPFCKNVAALEDIVLPDCKSPEWEGFLDRVVIQPTRKAIVEMSEEQRSALQLIEQWREQITGIEATEDHVATDDLLKRASKAVAEITPEHMKKQIQAYLVGHLAKIGWKWVGADKVFKPVAATTAPVEEKKEETPPTVPPAEEKPPVVAETPAQMEETEQSNAIAEAARPPVDEIDLKAEAEAQRAELANPTTPQINKNPNLAPPKVDLFAKSEDK